MAKRTSPTRVSPPPTRLSRTPPPNSSPRGEVTGKLFETVLLHRPQGLKARRLLLIGGGKAANFSAYELRKLAGTAVRFLKPKSIRGFALLLPDLGLARTSAEGGGSGQAAAVKSVVEGAYVANFDPDNYRSDRKDQRIDDLTIVTANHGERRSPAPPSTRPASSASRRTSPGNWSMSLAIA